MKINKILSYYFTDRKILVRLNLFNDVNIGKK